MAAQAEAEKARADVATQLDRARQRAIEVERAAAQTEEEAKNATEQADKLAKQLENASQQADEAGASRDQLQLEKAAFEKEAQDLRQRLSRA